MRFSLRQKRENRTLSMGDLIQKVLKECNIEKPITVNILSDKWTLIVDPVIAVHTKPDRIYKNILFIRSDHPAYSNEIVMMKESILKRLAAEYGFAFIRDIRVETRNFNRIKK